MSHDNDFPKKHGAQRTRTHARPRPAKKPLAAQEGQRIPARRADEHAYPVETPGRSSEPHAPRAQVPTDSRAPRTHAPGKPHPSRNQTPVQTPIAQTSTPRPSKTVFAIAAACVALALVLFGVVHWQNTRPIDIMVNGQQLQLPRAATVNDAFEAAGSPATAGNMLDIDGELLQEGSGTAYTATLDGQELDPTAAADTPLDGHTSIDFANGVDVEEPSNVAENQPIAHGVQDVGHGPLHIVTQKGQDGSGTIKTGQVSGKQQVIEVTNDPVDTVMKRCYPDTQGEKVVALTFDDGPWDDTNELLDVLRDNGAKATFFTVGNRISGDGVDTVKREVAEGHQVATHTWDHAAGDGQSVNLGYMTPEDQVAEVQKGYEAIEAATGAEASHVFRTPGGNYGEGVMRNVGPLISAEIGWNIDSQDWRKPGAAAIANQVKNAWPGAIVLMHDGGGDRSQTVEALKDALPYLKSQGYRFVTMDELLGYPLS